MEWNISIGTKNQVIALPDAIPDNTAFSVQINNRTVEAKWQRSTGTLFVLDPKKSKTWTAIHTRTRTVSKFPGESELNVNAEFTPSGAGHTLCMDATAALRIPGQEGRAGNGAKKANVIRSQITGKVIKVLVKPGDSAKAGDTLLIVEAMKMENRILALTEGVVESIKVSEGDTISTGAELVRFK